MRVGEERRGKGDGGRLRRAKEDVKEIRFIYVYFFGNFAFKWVGFVPGFGASIT